MSDIVSPVTSITRSLTRTLIGISAAFIVFDLVVVSARLAVRVKRGARLRLDDWLATVGFIFVCVHCGLAVASVANFTDNDVSVMTTNDSYRILYLGFFAFQFWAAALWCIKLSVLFTLLWLQDTFWWHLSIYGVITIQTVLTIGDSAYQWAKLKPLTSLSCAINSDDPCQAIYEFLSIFEASYQTSIEIIISLLPVTFLVQLRRPLREKILIALLMSVGLVASALSIHRTLVVRSFSDPSANPADLNVLVFTFSCAELFVGVIAACLFRLKSAFYTLLRRIGVDVDSSLYPSYNGPDDLPDLNVAIAKSTGLSIEIVH